MDPINANHTPPKFADKIVLITGVSYGLGEAMVEQFTHNGYIVLGCGRSQNKLDLLAKRYPQCEFSAVDVSNEFSVKEWADYLLAKYGAPKLIINNASIIDNPRRTFIETDLMQIKQIIEVNLLGTMYVTHAFLPYMRNYPNQTTIVNISSGWGREADIGLAGYCSSKFAIEGFTSVIAKENMGVVTVVSLDPGTGIATSMLATSTDNEFFAACPTPQEWATIAVPYILNISPKDSGKQLVVPEVKD